MLKAERLQAIVDITNKEKIVTSEELMRQLNISKGNRQKGYRRAVLPGTDSKDLGWCHVCKPHIPGALFCKKEGIQCR